MNDNNKSREEISAIELAVIMIIIAVLLAIAIPTIITGTHNHGNGLSSVKAHNLAIAAFSYSNDHNGIYPIGSSSTEIFQKLYDEKYLDLPGDVFLTRKGGISIAASDKVIKLKPENVSWDFATQDKSGVNSYDPNDLPLLFSDVDTAPTWKSGVNNATITASDPWGTDGVTMCTLGQQARFIRPNPTPGPGPTTVPLTNLSFTPAPGVTYVTRKP